MLQGWFIGDIGKTGYYFYANLPQPFIAGGCLTICIDTIILLQYYYQKDKKIEKCNMISDEITCDNQSHFINSLAKL